MSLISNPIFTGLPEITSGDFIISSQARRLFPAWSIHRRPRLGKEQLEFYDFVSSITNVSGRGRTYPRLPVTKILISTPQFATELYQNPKGRSGVWILDMYPLAAKTLHVYKQTIDLAQIVVVGVHFQDYNSDLDS
jgi:hypothetical protein